MAFYGSRPRVSFFCFASGIDCELADVSFLWCVTLNCALRFLRATMSPVRNTYACRLRIPLHRWPHTVKDRNGPFSFAALESSACDVLSLGHRIEEPSVHRT